MDSSILQLVIKAKDEASNVLKGVGNQIDDTKDHINSMSKNLMVAGGILTGVGVAGALAMKDWVDQAATAQAAMAIANQTLSNFSSNSGKSLTDLQAVMADVGQAAVRMGFDDEEASVVFAKLTAVTKDSTIANKAVASAMDLARYKGISLADAGLAIQKAMQGNAKILKEMGIAAEDGATAMDILNDVNSVVGGTAEKSSKQFKVQMEIMDVQIQNVKEALGNQFLPILSTIVTKISDFVGGLNNLNPEIIKWVAYGTLAVTAFGLIVGPILILIGMLPMLAAGFAILTGAMAAPLLIIGAIAAAVALLAFAWINDWGGIREITMAVWTEIQNIFNQLWTVLQAFITTNLPLFQEAWNNISLAIQTGLIIFQAIWNAVWPSMAVVLKAAWDIIVGIVKISWGMIQILLAVGLGLLTGDWSKAWNMMKNGLADVWTGIKGIVSGALDAITGMIRGSVNAWIGTLNGFINAINSATGKKGGAGIPSLPTFEQGGFVGSTGLAVVHAGEFVMSKDMLRGMSPVPAGVANNFNQPITINAIVSSNADMSSLGSTLAWYLRNSR